MKTILGTDYYTVREISVELQVTRQTIRNYMKSGRLKYTCVGGVVLVSREQLEAFVKGGSRGN